jgi:uncharacterized membrane protein YeiH
LTDNVSLVFAFLVGIDAAGLSLFAIVGAAKALSLGHGLVVVIIMGTVTATSGGLIRDIVCGEKAMLLREDIYATAALIRCAVFWIAHELSLDPGLALLVGTSSVFFIRGAAIIFDLDLPKPRS